jgi:hypothetical protein
LADAIFVRKNSGPHRTSRWLAAAIATLSIAYGQDPQKNRDREIQDLLLRLQQLQQEVAQLRQAQTPAEPESPEVSTADSQPAVDAASPAAASPVVETRTAETTVAQPSQPPSNAPPWTDRVRLHVYADASFQHHELLGVPDHYQVGELVLFGTAQLTPRLSGLTEVAIQTDNAGSLNDSPVQVERLLLQYRLNDYFTAAAGRYRSDIGYYSNAYLRGAWFQTAISRPHLFEFEDDGGVLPLHNVGLSFTGKVPSGWLGLHYTAETGNSVNWGSISTKVTDFTNHQAFTVALAAHPRAIPGLEIGFSAYRDKVTLPGWTALTRKVWSFHVVYNGNRFEFLNEGVVCPIQSDGSMAAGTVSGFYSQLAYRLGSNWGPFVRVEKMSVHSDAFFNPLTPYVPWRSTYTGGVRYDWTEAIAVKFELGHEAYVGYPAAYRAAAQIAFAF